ncbi:MAG: D-alanine--D-alanine ligase [Actinobacteria bacterium]|nr:MAG: D-alanine--D-alanine ligase [Actinomycetota bacterium]
MTQKIVVLLGGRSLERDISLKSGARVTAALESLGYRVVPLDIGPGLVDSLRSEKPDAVHIALHGQFGEDGMIQELLDFLGIPYTGCGALASMLAWDKDLTKRVLLADGVPTPAWVAFSADAIKEMGAARTLERIGDAIGGYPVCVKPARQGSALGIARVERFEDLADAMLAALGYDDKVLVEKWVEGTEIAVPVLGGNGDVEALPAVEIVPKGGQFDFDAMYTAGETEYFVPARLPDDVLARATETALAIHKRFGCRDISRMDAVVTADGTPQVLEISTQPGMTDTSIVPLCADESGLGFEGLVDRLVKAALARG